jgi:hypothetical protein
VIADHLEAGISDRVLCNQVHHYASCLALKLNIEFYTNVRSSKLN